MDSKIEPPPHMTHYDIFSSHLFFESDILYVYNVHFWRNKR